MRSTTATIGTVKTHAMLFSGLAAALPCLAEGPRDWKTDTLTGDWGGARTRWSEAGVDVSIGLRADVLSNRSGGIATGTRYMDHWNVELTADLDKLWGWAGTTAYVEVISNHGGKLNETQVGSFNGIDNIEVGSATTKFFNAWVEKSFAEGRYALLAGLYAVDSEFFVNDATGIFLHPTGGTPGEIAQTGQNGPSVFPTSSVGIRARWTPNPRVYVQAALLDGVPGDPNNPKGTHIRFNRGDGTLLVAEAGLRPAEPDEPEPAAGAKAAEPREKPISHFAVGAWRYTPRFDDLIDVDGAGNPLRRHNRGAYFVAEQTVYHEPDHLSQGLALFFRYGVASRDVNPLDYSWTAGVYYKGLLPGRDDDEAGIHFLRSHAGTKFRQATPTDIDHEDALEITYRAQITPWLAIQPSVQRIWNPGFDPALGNSWIVGGRVEIAF